MHWHILNVGVDMRKLTIGVNILNILKDSQRILYSLPATVSVIQARKLSRFCLERFCCCQIICIDGHK
jgi:hypothetical protein